MANSSDTSDNVKSRRPAESAFKQQRLPAWQPILTAGTVLPTFFVIGIAFIPVGISLFYFSNAVKEKVIPYTDCKPAGSDVPCSEQLKNNRTGCSCSVVFNLTEDFAGTVFMYYGLTNYYQNHRRYVKSRDDQQLLGRLSADPVSDCEPFRYAEAEPGGARRPIAPCGAIANSLFNDVLTLKSLDFGLDVPLLRTGIAWTSDKNKKFRNPPGPLETAFQNFSKPKNWKVNIYELDKENPDNNGFQNEDLIVWMRTAALPTFRKLYRRIDHSREGFRNGLSKGEYQLDIEYNYEVTAFHGTKSAILSTTSLLGGKNPFLGVAYIVVGCLCLLLGVVLLVIHIKFAKSTTEMINVNPRTPYN